MKLFIGATRACHFLSALVFVCLVGQSNAFGVSVLDNGEFTGGVGGWYVPDELQGWTPYNGDGTCYINPWEVNHDTTVLIQNLNVAITGTAVVNFSADIKLDSDSTSGEAFHVLLVYIDTGGIQQTQELIRPLGAELTGSGFTTISSGSLVLSDAVRVIRLEVVTDAEGNGVGTGQTFDNCSLDISAQGVDDTVTDNASPVVSMVAPYLVGYGETITITGSGFGASQGKVYLNGSETGVAISSWSDTAIEISLASPALDGHLIVETSGQARNSEVKGLRILTPHYYVDFPADSLACVAGQTVKTAFLLDMKNGYTPSSSVVVSSSSHPTASFTPSTFTSTGGGEFALDTTGMSAGTATVGVQSSGSSVGPYSDSINLTVYELDQVELYVNYSNLVTSPFTLLEQSVIDTSVTLKDSGDNELPYGIANLTWSSSDSSVLKVAQRGQYDAGPKLMPQANGTCTLTATGPGGFSQNYEVTVNLPAGDQVTSLSAAPTSIPNDGSSVVRVSAAANTNITGFTIYGSDLESVNSSFDGTSAWVDVRVNQGAVPGENVIKFTAGSASRGIIVDSYNDPTTAMMSGSVYYSDYAGGHQMVFVQGPLEFYDAVTGIKSFEVQLAEEGTGYTLAGLTPGSYKVRFSPDDYSGSGNYDPTYHPSGSSVASASTVVLTAGSTTSDVNFYIKPDENEEGLIVPPSPQIAGSNLTMDMGSTTPGVAYVVEVSDSMEPDSWTVLIEFSGDGQGTQIQDAIAGRLKRFYRIRQL